jgi:hypothetical protein
MAPDPRLEDYLDHVCAPLVGVVPYARRAELRAELREHLEAFVATHEELGSPRDVGVLMALRQFGPPRELARMWAREWKQGAAPARFEPAWRAMRIGLVSFGFASVVALILEVIICSVQARNLAGLEMPLMLLAGGILPALAGLATGLLAPARHALGSFFALALVILSSAALGLSGVGDSAGNPSLAAWGLGLAAVQAFLWIPLGCGAAALGGWLRARLVLRPGQWVLQ